MKNQYRQDNGSFHAIIHNTCPEHAFKAFGATEVVHVPSEMADAADIYMVKINGSWRYAHVTGGAAYYASASFYECPTWKAAWFANKLRVAGNDLARAIEKEREMLSSYVAALTEVK